MILFLVLLLVVQYQVFRVSTSYPRNSLRSHVTHPHFQNVISSNSPVVGEVFAPNDIFALMTFCPGVYKFLATALTITSLTVRASKDQLTLNRLSHDLPAYTFTRPSFSFSPFIAQYFSLYPLSPFLQFFYLFYPSSNNTWISVWPWITTFTISLLHIYCRKKSKT